MNKADSIAMRPGEAGLFRLADRLATANEFHAPTSGHEKRQRRNGVASIIEAAMRCGIADGTGWRLFGAALDGACRESGIEMSEARRGKPHPWDGWRRPEGVPWCGDAADTWKRFDGADMARLAEWAGSGKSTWAVGWRLMDDMMKRLRDEVHAYDLHVRVLVSEGIQACRSRDGRLMIAQCVLGNMGQVVETGDRDEHVTMGGMACAWLMAALLAPCRRSIGTAIANSGLERVEDGQGGEPFPFPPPYPTWLCIELLDGALRSDPPGWSNEDGQAFLDGLREANVDVGDNVPFDTSPWTLMRREGVPCGFKPCATLDSLRASATARMGASQMMQTTPGAVVGAPRRRSMRT